ncbi:MAG: hypothetical protein IKP24_01960 [Alphaproteobacteria bacterium]|nr:hypothetical protein [Alphaproteobacteria bacterium]
MQRVTYIYSGETQTFYFNFPYIEKSNIVVTVDGKTAPAYNVIGVKGGLNPDFPFSSGRIVFVKPLKMFQSITIERHLPYERPVDFQPTAKISPMDLNLDMNNTMELLKDLKDDVDDLRNKYKDITNKEGIDTLLEKIDLFNKDITTFAEQLEILEQVPGMQEVISIIQSTIESITATISEIISSLNLQISKTENLLDYVVESQFPTVENNYTWYRKYKSGWVEMGGLVSTNSSDSNIITLPITMADTNYHIIAMNEPTDSINAWGWVFTKRNSKTTTGFMLSSRYGSGQEVSLRARWQVSGLCA